jgi:hypothetical protein
MPEANSNRGAMSRSSASERTVMEPLKHCNANPKTTPKQNAFTGSLHSWEYFTYLTVVASNVTVNDED